MGITEVIDDLDIDWHGRPSCAVLPGGTVVMAYVSQNSHTGGIWGDTGAGGVHIRFSDDYGATWTAEDTTLEDAAVTGFPIAGEPFLMLAPNGNLVMHIANCWNNAAGTSKIISTDGGATWSAPAAVVVNSLVGDADFLALIDDYFVVGSDMYMAGRISTDAAQAGVKSIFCKSTDNGANWTWISDVCNANVAHEIGIEYLGDNRIIAILRDNGDTQTYRCFSSDMGAHWTTPDDITYMVGKTGRHRIFTLNHLKGGASWWEDDHLVMGCFEFTAGSTRTNCLLFSSDRGITWSPPRYVDSAYADAGYGHIFWNPVTEQVVFMNYAGTSAAAALKQYNVTVDWKETITEPTMPVVYFVDATSGDDDNDGLSPAQAWQTITKVNAAELNAGDTVLFKRGETFAGQLAPDRNGSDGNPVTYGAYGTGARPIIDGSAANCAFYLNDDYHHMRFEHLDFKGSTGTYSTIYCYDAHDLYFDDCIGRDAAARHGMSLRSANHVVYNVTLEDCLFTGNYMSGLLAETLASHDVLVKKSTAHTNGHSTSGDHGFYIGGGVTLDGCIAYSNSGAGFKMNDNESEPSYYPVTKNGVAYGNNYGILFTHKNALAYNNLVYSNANCNLLFYGNTWGGYKCYFNTLVNSTNATERGMVFTSGVSAGSEIKDNIIVQDLAVVTRGAMHTTIAMSTLAAAYTIDYNTYYTAGGSASDIRFGYDDTDLAEGRQSWNDWQGAGHDAHSTFLATTPDFVTRYTDLHPADGGDLKALGVAIAGYTTDKDGNTRADPPTPGCYEEAAA